ncbi:protein dpy-30 homolog [Drosophila subobscura]|uniref:protein dpy-30 homolog n=1 Tax=Drosophila subobscura TaxID=7241 RepID=UPI00155A596C|nr:protein dpy-30 homolog [Drosophila subobscura]
MLSKQAKVKSKSCRKQSKVQSQSQRKSAIDCPPMEKPKKKEAPPPQAEAEAEAECNRPKFYRSPEQKRVYLEQQAVPILMEGMLAVAREQPRDPIGYLEKFWLQDSHKCDIQLPQNIL